MSTQCRHDVITTRDQGWRFVTRCYHCGEVLRIDEIPRNQRAREHADHYRALRAAWHARKWR